MYNSIDAHFSACTLVSLILQMCVCLLFYDVGKRYSVAVSLERSYYYVAESSGLVNINIVTSDRYDKDFTVKLSVILGRHQTRGDYGKQKCVCCVCVFW